MATLQKQNQAENQKQSSNFFSSLLFFAICLAVAGIAFFLIRPNKQPPVVAEEQAEVKPKTKGRHNLLVSEMSTSTAWEGQKAEPNPDLPAKVEAEAPLPVDESASKEALDKAMALVDGGNIQEAMALLEEILKKEPNNEMALIEMGMIHLIDLKDSTKALSFLEKSLRINPSNPIVVSEVADIYDSVGMQDAGINFFQSLYHDHPENGAIAGSLGKMLNSQKRYNDAIPYLEAAAAQETTPLAVADLGTAYSRTGQSDKAIEEFNKAIALEERRAQSSEDESDNGSGNAIEGGRDPEALAMLKLTLAQEYYKTGNQDDAKKVVDGIKKIVSEETLAKIYQENKDRFFEF